MNPQNRVYLLILFVGGFFGSLITTLESDNPGTLVSPILIFSWLVCFTIVSPTHEELKKWRNEQ